MSEAFYVDDGDHVVSTGWTRGPWADTAQHGGPPAALLGRAVERLEPVGEMRVVRITVELLRPVPISTLRIEARVLRPGHKVQFSEALLVAGDQEVARATAWRIRPRPAIDAPIGLDPPPFALPDRLHATERLLGIEGPMYFGGLEWRFAHGSFPEPGPASAWMRLRIPLVEGESPSALQRVLVAADSGSGIGNELAMDRYRFINTDLTVNLVRMPEGEWVGFQARSRIAPMGTGLAETSIWDRTGRIGAGLQSLLVEARDPGT
jgi:hypothetical protein